MEVHHHTSSATGHKKWSHYFWEFFMLFLAVTLGFLVENQREHFIEHQREKQLIKSLANDIIADTLRLHTIIDLRTEREIILDSLSTLLDSGPPYNSTNHIYYYGIFIPRNFPITFIPNDGTLQQLKNAGGLRLIRERKVVDSITRYDVSLRSLNKMADNEMSIIIDFRTVANRIYDSRVLDKMMDSNNIPSPPTNNPPLMPFTRSDLNDFNYKLFGIKALNRAERRELSKVLLQARNLLNLLVEEYRLK